MEKAGWPAIPYDGQLLMSHQDALLLGGKVQAPAGYADHVVFLYPELCEKCGTKICIEACSGQAITPGRRRRAEFRPREMRPLRRLRTGTARNHFRTILSALNIAFRAGTGGLHSAEN